MTRNPPLESSHLGNKREISWPSPRICSGGQNCYRANFFVMLTFLPFLTKILRGSKFFQGASDFRGAPFCPPPPQLISGESQLQYIAQQGGHKPGKHGKPEKVRELKNIVRVSGKTQGNLSFCRKNLENSGKIKNM